MDSNIEGLKNDYEFELEIQSSQIRTSFNNPSYNYCSHVDNDDKSTSTVAGAETTTTTTTSVDDEDAR